MKIALVGLFLFGFILRVANAEELSLEQKALSANITLQNILDEKWITLPDFAFLLQGSLKEDPISRRSEITFKDHRLVFLPESKKALYDDQIIEMKHPARLVSGVRVIPFSFATMLTEVANETISSFVVKKTEEKQEAAEKTISYEDLNLSGNAKIILQAVEQNKAIPIGFKGDDIRKLHSELGKRIPAKNDFESLEEYKKRLRSVNLDTVYAFQLESPSLSYYVEERLLRIYIGPFLATKTIEDKLGSYYATNAFGAVVSVTTEYITCYGIDPINFPKNEKLMFPVQMLPEKAKGIKEQEDKNNIRALLICKPCLYDRSDLVAIGYRGLDLDGPSYHENHGKAATFDDPYSTTVEQYGIHAELLLILIYNVKTGEQYISIDTKKQNLELKSVSGRAESIKELVAKRYYQEVIKNYGADKTLDPTENYLLGLCYQETGETQKAENIWQTLLSGPEKEGSLLALAHLKNKNGAFTESEKFFRQFFREFPSSQYQPSALFGLAEVLFQENAVQESLDIMNRLRRRYPFSNETEKATQFLNQELGPYTIQIGPFVDLNRAEKVTDDLSSEGYEAYVARILDGSVSYRVRIGNFKDKKKAESAGQILKKNTGLDYFITE